ncbi:MAG: 4-hydroxybenzoate octaprenyltransferase [Rikenellaceae bacterium]
MFKRFSRLVMLSHTIFALPFALIGYTYALASTAAQFDWLVLAKVLLCMLFARNTAMGFNRWADREIDAENPRTADREIPAGRVSARAAFTFVVVNALLFVATTVSINMLCALLSPVALAVVMGYSYCKRFTSFAHLVLGLGLAIAPVGAYIAVSGEFALVPCLLALVVMTWCGGFDIIYALQDREFDIQRGLHSIPTRFSVGGALAISSMLHVVSAVALALFTWQMTNSAWWRWVGVVIFVALLILQHILVTPTRQRNIGIAFGTVNGIASVVLAAFMIGSMVVNLI